MAKPHFRIVHFTAAGPAIQQIVDQFASNDAGRDTVLSRLEILGFVDEDFTGVIRRDGEIVGMTSGGCQAVTAEAVDPLLSKIHTLKLTPDEKDRIEKALGKHEIKITRAYVRSIGQDDPDYYNLTSPAQFRALYNL